MPESTGSCAQPLLGKRVLVAASEGTAGKLSSCLESWGARVIRFQSMEIRRLEDTPALDGVLARLSMYAWVIFTSANGVRFFSSCLDERGVASETRRNLPVCAVGPATAKTAVEFGFRVALVPLEYVAEGVLTALAEQPGGMEALKGRRILIPRARQARDVLPLELERSGAIVDVLACYESVPGELDERTRRIILEERLDLLVFTSSANLNNFVTILGDVNAIRILNSSKVAVLGPVVASTSESLGKRPEITPAQSTTDSLLQAIEGYFRAGRV